MSLALKRPANVAKKEKQDLRDLPGQQDQPVPLVQVRQQRHKSRRRQLGLKKHQLC